MKLKKYLLYISSALLLTGCYKIKLESPDQATLNVIHAYADNGGGGNILFEFNNSKPIFKNAYRLSWWEWDGVATSGVRAFGVPTDAPLNLRLVLESDTLKSIYQKTIQFKPFEIYSLYISGTKLKIDTLLIRDEIPSYTDSVAGIRFVNLSSDAGAISINLKGEAPGTQVSTLAYQQITPFRKYAAKKENANYTFEIRQVSTGNLLTTYSFNSFSNYVPRFKNVTLVLMGVLTNGYGIEIVKVSNY